MEDHTTLPPSVPAEPIASEPPCLTAALDYLRRGWCPVALCPPDHSGTLPPGHRDECTRPGKRPPFKWKHLMQRRPTETELRQWWGSNPALNVGVLMGSVSGLVGIDIDGPEGQEELLRISGGDLPHTLEFTTPGGGRRLLYPWPRDRPTRTTSAPTARKPLHLLGDGSLSVFPPSGHVMGGNYGSMDADTLNRLHDIVRPEWVDHFAERAARRQRQPGGGEGVLVSGADNPVDVRTAEVWLSRADPAISGKGGHNQTFKVACRLVKGFRLSTDTALTLMLRAWNPRCEPPWSEKELRHKVEDARRKGISPPMGTARFNPPPPTAPSNAADNGRAAGTLPVPSVGRVEAGETDQDDGGAGPLPGMRRGTDLEALPVEWGWIVRMPLGAVTVVEGKKGVGKGQLLAKAAADFTGGPRLPAAGARPRVLGPGIWLSGEDDVSRVTKPRLVAAGADLSAIIFPTSPDDPSADWRPMLPGDLPSLERLVRRTAARWLFLDPYIPFIAGGVNNNIEQAIRYVLDPLNHLARETGCLITLTRNLSKARGVEAIDQGLGSAAVGNVARSVIRLSKHPDREGRYVLAVVSCNLGELPPALLYRIEAADGVPRIIFEGTSDLTADDLADGPQEHGERGPRADARRLLMDRLNDGCIPANDLIREARDAVISERTLRTVKDELRVESRVKVMNGKRLWLWCRPKEGWPDVG